MELYYMHEGEQYGPVDSDEVATLRKTGVINDETLVWKDGLADWAPFSSLVPQRAMAAAHPVAEPGARTHWGPSPTESGTPTRGSRLSGTETPQTRGSRTDSRGSQTGTRRKTRTRSLYSVQMPNQKRQVSPGQIGLGILMMVGAAVWFFGGLAVGVIFFYSPILFILGLITFCKGIFGR